MGLIGVATQRRQARQWESLQRLAGHFLDVVAGLPTLKVFGRAKAQAQTVREVSEANRRATLGVLRISFLSSFALELLATLSVALVAVSIGLRLVDGSIALRTGLFVLVLAPEAYLPLRLVGSHFHASAEGMAAAEQVFRVLETPPTVHPGDRTAPAPDLRTCEIRLEQVTVHYPDRPSPALDRLDLVLRPGQVLAVTGRSGAGKSTLLALLLGFVLPTSGRVVLAAPGASPVDLTACDPASLRRQVAWVPQNPYLFAGTVADNVRLGRSDASPEDVRAALLAAGFTDVDGELPAGIETRVAEGGAGLSAGQRRRVAVARAVLRDAPLLLLDEPTAALDEESEDRLVTALRELLPGRAAVVATHRPTLLQLADSLADLPLARERVAS
jgi:thiol reductant ABC exporter CydD subunit